MSCLFKVRGEFGIRCLNPDGTVAWARRFPNGATLEGLTHILATEFGGGAQITTWYIAPINNADFEELSEDDTAASHAGWTEFADYSQATRQEWVEGTPAGGILASQTVASFTITAPGTLRGAFLASSSTKSGTAGVLWATGELAGEPEAVSIGQVVQIRYTIIAAGA